MTLLACNTFLWCHSGELLHASGWWLRGAPALATVNVSLHSWKKGQAKLGFRRLARSLGSKARSSVTYCVNKVGSRLHGSVHGDVSQDK